MSLGMFRNELDLDPNNEKKYNVNEETMYNIPLFNYRTKSEFFI